MYNVIMNKLEYPKIHHYTVMHLAIWAISHPDGQMHDTVWPNGHHRAMIHHLRDVLYHGIMLQVIRDARNDGIKWCDATAPAAVIPRTI